MAPITMSSRLPPAIVELLAPRDPEPRPQPAPAPTLAALAGRLHAAASRPPAAVSRTLPSPAAPDAPSRAALVRAPQTTDTVPGSYPSLDSGPDPGTVVGIVLGSVGGFLLLLWLVYTCFQIGGRGDTVSSYGTASVVTRKSRRRHSRQQSSHHHRSPPTARRETVEIRTSRPPPPPMAAPPPPQERVVVEEHIRRERSQGPPPPAPPPMMATAPPPPRIVTDDEEDEVVVIEEHDPPPRRHKTKSHRRRSSSARRESSGYREVDPDRFAGGESHFREVRRSSRHGR